MKNIRTQTDPLKNLLGIALTGLFITACDGEKASHEDIVKADLLVIIDSLGSPCGRVLKYESAKELGYTVHCKTGDQYVISVNPQGRVGIQNRK